MSGLEKMNIPAVATRGVIVFPEQEIMIEVGRPKSIKAIEEAEKYFNNHVLLVSQKDVLVDDPRDDELFDVGTLCYVKSVKRKQGFLRVTFRGVKRAKIDYVNDDEEMLFSSIELLEDIAGAEDEQDALVRSIMKEFEAVSLSNINLPAEVIQQLTRGISPAQLSDQFAQYFPTKLERKQELLETLNVNERLFMILEDISHEQRISSIENVINERVRERVDENQKEFYLREKMRAIREELGDAVDVTEDSDKFREMLEENPYPEHVKEKAYEEIRRYEMLPQVSGESAVVRNYIEWLLTVPWWQETEDNDDLKEVRRRLDEDHFDLIK